MEAPATIVNRLLNARAFGDATNDDLRAFLVSDGKDAATVDAAIAQLDNHAATRLQFTNLFGY